jgi:hypothetical protein
VLFSRASQNLAEALLLDSDELKLWGLVALGIYYLAALAFVEFKKLF